MQELNHLDEDEIKKAIEYWCNRYHNMSVTDIELSHTEHQEGKLIKNNYNGSLRHTGTYYNVNNLSENMIVCRKCKKELDEPFFCDCYFEKSED